MSAVEKLIQATPTKRRNLYQKYDIEEEIVRLAYHYNVPCEFFLIVTGGQWNTYSCSIFGANENMTQAQERKLDEFARMMKLKPGMRILDVGCGWGGPLTYLCKKYSCTGEGITVTHAQIPYAQNRAFNYGVNARFHLSHWETFKPKERFDAIFTDEVVVHFQDLQGFFKRCHAWLKPGGRVVNKELHLTEKRFADWSDPLGVHVNKVYGFTGNYRLLEDEVACAKSAGFEFVDRLDIDMKHYTHTVQKYWLHNLKLNRERLIKLTSEKHFNDFHKYLRCTLVSFRKNVFNQHILAFKKY